MTKISLEEVEKIRSEAERLQLSGRKLLNDTKLVIDECNGVGAEWMGFVCGVVSTLNPALFIPSCIHDLRYHHGGSDAERLAADAEWLANSMISIDDRYGWYNPMRYIMRKKASRYYNALRTAGSWAWTEPAETEEK